MRLIGHRGCAGQYPENTIRAVRAAAPHVDAVEIDVRRCGTGEIVVFHDETLGRLTGREGRVDGTPWATLRDLEVLGSGETIPRLPDLVEAVPAGVGVNVELKHDGMGGEVARILDGIDDDALLSSFRRGALEEVRDSGIPRGYVFDGRVGRSLSVAADLDCVAVHPARRLLRRGVVRRAHEAGFEVNVWTAETRRQAVAARDRGVDGLIADRWDLLTE